MKLFEGVTYGALYNVISGNNIIGITGQLTAGKSTLARAMQFLLTPFYNVHIMSFARDVKAIANLFGWDGKKDDKGRKLLQLIGTEVGREYMPDLWIKYLIKNALLEMNPTTKHKNIIIIDDLRFENEAEWLKQYFNSAIIKVMDIEDPNKKVGLEHVSEKGIDPKFITFEVINDMDAFRLIKDAHKILWQLNYKTLSVKE